MQNIASELQSPLPKISSICVFAGSKTGNNKEFEEKTVMLGKAMLEHKYSLVYGGGTVGLMGVLANILYYGGGQVTGIIPESLAPREVSGPPIGKSVVVKDMHSRKLAMYQNADAFIALPGGFGTFEELLEVITWQQLGIHTKPIGLLNVAGYYDPLVQLIKNAVAEGFIKEYTATNILVVSSDPRELLQRISTHVAPKSEITWMNESQI